MLDKYLTIILPILIGYLLGSFLPAYFITKWVRNIDIRMVGDGNPGTANVKRNVGTSAAVLTGFYDVTKGLLAMAIASTLFNSSLLIVNLSGLAAVCGHKFPFYLQFKGGRGIAATVGIFLFTIARASIINFTFKDILVASAYIVTYALCVHFATHDDDFFTVTMLPIIAAILIFKVKFFGDLILLLALISFIFIEAVRNLKNLKMFRLSSEELPLWRTFIRPAGMSFLFLYDVMGKSGLLILIGSVLAVSFLADIVRVSSISLEDLFHKEFFKGFRVYKRKERGNISSITNFLVGVFLTFLLFKENVAAASLGFLVFGDMMAKIVGINYGKTKILRFKNDKTLEGFLGFLSASFSVSYFLWLSKTLPIWLSIVGVLTASMVEVFPISVDSNISVPILSGATMYLLSALPRL